MLDLFDCFCDIIVVDMLFDFWIIDLCEVVFVFGSVTGDDVIEDVFDMIFERFCIGK